MDAIKIEILNPKELQLILGLQALDLIKIIKEPVVNNRLKDNNRTGLDRIDDIEATEWRNLTSGHFLNGYGAAEPEYTEADIIEPNPD